MGSDPGTAAVAVMEGAEGDTLPKGPLREKALVNSQNVPCEVLLYESELIRYSNKYFLFLLLFQLAITDGLEDGSFAVWFCPLLNNNIIKRRALGCGACLALTRP